MQGAALFNEAEGSSLLAWRTVAEVHMVWLRAACMLFACFCGLGQQHAAHPWGGGGAGPLQSSVRRKAFGGLPDANKVRSARVEQLEALLVS